jgi:hypothetical protein
LYSVVLAGLYYLLVLPKRFMREVSRVRAGRCIACGYDLGYDFVRGCPECGWRREGRAAGGPPSMPPERHVEASAGGDRDEADADEHVLTRQPRRSPAEVTTV